ncbi:MAG TPA: hypothetical protein DEO82_02875, partial [Eubacterium sp.]|nr:hypothetical protein [Eubacterium sp.]
YDHAEDNTYEAPVVDNLNFMQDLKKVDATNVNPVIFSKDIENFDVKEELFPERQERAFAPVHTIDDSYDESIADLSKQIDMAIAKTEEYETPSAESYSQPIIEPVIMPAPEPVMQPVMQPVAQPVTPSVTPSSAQSAGSDAADLSLLQADLGREVRELTGVNKEPEYTFPPVYLLKPEDKKAYKGSDSELREVSAKLTKTLREFGVDATVTNATKGPTVTQYEVTPKPGVKVRKIVDLQDDIKLSLAARDIRIEAPIPGKSAVGIEVPNTDKSAVNFRELIESKEFKEHPSNLCVAIGKDISGHIILADLAKMPHLLIAGSTGSGKSVCINTIIMSLIYKSKPSDVKMIMVDPKVVELKVYNKIPHLLIPVVTEPKKAAGALNWAVSEMDRRYNLFAKINARDLKGYNQRVEDVNKTVPEDQKLEKLPQIVIIVDEMAELMMAAQSEVEASIVRLAQLARACGIHLVIATQRPTVNVITGLIKANVPSKIAFAVSSGTDSRTIIDRVGAENLLGKGDMLYFPGDYPNPVRVQGAFVSDDEVNAVTEYLENNSAPVSYNESVESHIVAPAMSESQAFGQERDAYFEQAGRFIIEKQKASIGLIQRMYKVGFNRAARIVDQLTEAGVVGPEEGTKPRKILMTMEEFEQLLTNS